MSNEKPNIIFIVIDALRPKNLSMFGYEKETDKNLKKIAKENLLFIKYFSTSNSTAPALNSIFTGLYPPNHGILHQFPYTTDEEIENMYQKVKFWFPSYLKEKGIETRNFFIPMHKQPLFIEKKVDNAPDCSGDYPIAEKIGERGFYLPSSSNITDEELTFVCTSLKQILGDILSPKDSSY